MEVTNKSRWLLGVAVVILGMALTLWGCSTKEEKAAAFISKGDRLLAEGDPVRAILEYKNALQMDPRNATATLGLGKALLQQEEYQRAMSAFRSALELNPEFDEARVQVAWLLAMSKNGQPALLEVAQIKHPEAYQPKVDLIKARALMSSERYQEAIDILSQVKDGPQNQEVQTLLAISFQAVGAADKMKQAVAAWRELTPADPASYLFMAQYALDHGEKGKVIEELQKMLDAGQGDNRVALLRAQFLDRWGFAEEAQAAYEGLPPSPEIQAAQADFWIRMGNRQKARSILEDLIASTPHDVPAVIKLARLLTEDNEQKGALELIENTLKRDLKRPDREAVLLAKATLMAQQADWEGARKLCDALLAQNQGNLDAHFLLGKVLLGVRNPGGRRDSIEPGRRRPPQ